MDDDELKGHSDTFNTRLENIFNKYEKREKGPKAEEAKEPAAEEPKAEESKAEKNVVRFVGPDGKPYNVKTKPGQTEADVEKYIMDKYYGGSSKEGQEAPAESPPAPAAAPQGYSFEELTPDQRKRLQDLMSSTRSPEMGGGLNPEFLLNAQTFNATPLEKRKELFRLLAQNQRAHGGVIRKNQGGLADSGEDYTKYNARILRALIKRYGSEQKARQVMRETDGGELLRIMQEEEEKSSYSPEEQLLLKRYANR
jgi:hypothetical protein